MPQYACLGNPLSSLLIHQSVLSQIDPPKPRYSDISLISLLIVAKHY